MDQVTERANDDGDLLATRDRQGPSEATFMSVFGMSGQPGVNSVPWAHREL